MKYLILSLFLLNSTLAFSNTLSCHEKDRTDMTIKIFAPENLSQVLTYESRNSDPYNTQYFEILKISEDNSLKVFESKEYTLVLNKLHPELSLLKDNSYNKQIEINCAKSKAD